MKNKSNNRFTKNIKKVAHPVAEARKVRSSLNKQINNNAQKIVEKYQEEDRNSSQKQQEFNNLSSLIKMIFIFFFTIIGFIFVVWLTNATQLKTTISIILAVVIVIGLAVAFALKIIRKNK